MEKSQTTERKAEGRFTAWLDLSAEYLGYELMRGAMKSVARIICWVMVLFIIGTLLRNVCGWGMDSTDRSGWDRSGLKLHTDAMTGVQYLSDGHGGLTVRLDADGKPIRSK